MQRQEIEHIEWMQRQKDKIIQQAALKQEREDARKAAIKSLPHPYQRELDCCEHLIGYITNQRVRYGQIVDNEQAARQAQEALQKEAIQEKINQRHQEGKVEFGMSKADREAANTVTVGGGKKQKGKKQKKIVEYEEALNLDMQIIREFALIGIAPPVGPDDLEDAGKKVQEKMQFFKDNGADKFAEQVEEFEK